MTENPFNFVKVVAVSTLALTVFVQSSIAQSVVRLTMNTGMDLAPAWDPRGGTIAYMRSVADSGSGVLIGPSRIVLGRRHAVLLPEKTPSG